MTTRQQMLDAINLKIAQVQPSDYGTSYFLPVMIGDVFQWQYKTPWIKSWPDTRSEITENWGDWTKPLHDQDDDCVSYIYNLL